MQSGGPHVHSGIGFRDEFTSVFSAIFCGMGVGALVLTLDIVLLSGAARPAVAIITTLVATLVFDSLVFNTPTRSQRQAEGETERRTAGA